MTMMMMMMMMTMMLVSLSGQLDEDDAYNKPVWAT
jgi:hypothetical protein